MAESLCCPPETITLSIGYTPIFKKKKKRGFESFLKNSCRVCSLPDKAKTKNFPNIPGIHKQIFFVNAVFMAVLSEQIKLRPDRICEEIFNTVD